MFNVICSALALALLGALPKLHVLDGATANIDHSVIWWPERLGFEVSAKDADSHFEGSAENISPLNKAGKNSGYRSVSRGGILEDCAVLRFPDNSIEPLSSISNNCLVWHYDIKVELQVIKVNRPRGGHRHLFIAGYDHKVSVDLAADVQGMGHTGILNAQFKLEPVASENGARIGRKDVCSGLGFSNLFGVNDHLLRSAKGAPDQVNRANTEKCHDPLCKRILRSHKPGEPLPPALDILAFLLLGFSFAVSTLYAIAWICRSFEKQK